ncbi:MAG: hypothetical protein K9M99_05820 [Candidatus Cloacimonetes bacterium]|nr:hypothetical protein [Candidatus Cloacimonadota bacterium]
MRSVMKMITGIAFVLLLSSCASHYLPVGGPGLTVINDAYLYQDTDYELVALNRYWVRDPQDLNDYFTTFLVTVKNRSGEKLNITNKDFALLDENGNQSDPLSLEQVQDILLNNQLQYLVVKNLEEQDEQKLITIRDQTDTLEEWRRAKRNLMSDSFTFGEIYPQAKRTGYLFFPKVNIKNDELTLIYRSQSLKFRR